MNATVKPLTTPARNVVPADLDAEAAVLSAMLLEPSAVRTVVATGLRHRDFYADANRRIYEAIVELHEAGRPVDTVSVASVLRSQARLDQIGGTPYLAQIVDATPAVANVGDHAQIVIAKCRSRRLAIGFEQAAVRIRHGEAPDDVGRDIESLLESTTQPIEAPLRSLRERLEAARHAGPRHPTGIRDLDVHLRGGLRVQKALVIGGAPGAGKTTLMVQIGRNLARDGVAVGFLAVDEEAAGIDARNLESLGIERDLAEQPDTETIERALEELESLPFVLFEDVLIEEAFEQLARLYPGQPRAVLIDSLQTARTRQSEAIENIRERTTDAIVTAKRCARAPETEALLVITSELARGAYRSKQAADQIEDLAAFKESGAVEYQAHVALVLRTVKGDSALVSAAIPKNRTGTKGAFGLRLDFERATFCPAELPRDDDSGETAIQANRGKAEADARVLASIVLHHPGQGERELRAELRSAGHTWGTDRLDAAKRILMAGHSGSKLVNRGNVRASQWFVEAVP